MDCRSDFIKNIIQMISNIDEEYLIGLSNKGLYNRAVKDLGDGSGVDVQVEEVFLRLTLPDGNSCELTADIKKYKCSCPSRSICKHVLMGFIYIKNNPGIFGTKEEETGKEEEPASIEPDFSPLLEMEDREIRRLIGEKVYNDIISRLKFGVKSQIEEGSILTVKFPEEDTQVRFPCSEPLKNAICSCKASDFCRHKGEAVIHYRLFKGIGVDEASIIGEVKVAAENLLEIKKFVRDLLVSGLARMPESSIELMEQMAVICHNSNIPSLEKMFRRLGASAEYYFKKEASFSRGGMRNILSTIYNIADALDKNIDNPVLTGELAGEFKSSYYDIPPVDIHGMGAEGWITKSGYSGITYYFFNEKMNRWLTYTVSRPTFYEGSGINPAELYKLELPWGVESPVDKFSKSHIKLTNGKMNGEGRLSSSSRSKARVIGDTQFSEISLAGYMLDDWMTAFEKLSEGLLSQVFESDENYNLFFLKISSWGKSSFDKIRQVFNMPLYDKEDRMINISLKFTPENKGLIKKFEGFERLRRCPGMLLGRLYLASDCISVYPITAYYKDGTKVNLTLE